MGFVAPRCVGGRICGLRPDLGRRRCHGVIDTRAMCLEVRPGCTPLALWAASRTCLGPLVWWSWVVGEGCMHMWHAHAYRGPIGRTRRASRALYVPRACSIHVDRTCVCTPLSHVCVVRSMQHAHGIRVHAHAMPALRASRDRRCPLAPVCAWTDTGVTGRVLSCSPHGSRTGSAHRSPRRRKTSDDRALFLRVRTPDPISDGADGT